MDNNIDNLNFNKDKANENGFSRNQTLATMAGIGILLAIGGGIISEKNTKDPNPSELPLESIAVEDTFANPINTVEIPTPVETINVNQNNKPPSNIAITDTYATAPSSIEVNMASPEQAPVEKPVVEKPITNNINETTAIDTKKNTKPVVKSKKISAPYPNSYKIVNGKMVCDKKKDKPSKSKTNKKVHMDMECCLDPDEVPNPHCDYSAPTYKKLIDKLK